MIRDRNIQYKRQRDYISYIDFDVTGAGASLEASAPAFGEIAAIGVGGMPMTTDDQITKLLQFPTYWDITQEIGVTVVYTALAAASAGDTCQWIVLYDQADVDEPVIFPLTVLDTTIAQSTYTEGTANAVNRTSRGIINANTFDDAAQLGMLCWDVELSNDDTFEADEVFFLGLSIDYYPSLTVDVGGSERGDFNG
jgi:hypothetical protein